MISPKIYSGIFYFLFSPVGKIWRLSEKFDNMNGNRLIIQQDFI
jgi:hypothetical protein